MYEKTKQLFSQKKLLFLFCCVWIGVLTITRDSTVSSYQFYNVEEENELLKQISYDAELNRDFATQQYKISDTLKTMTKYFNTANIIVHPEFDEMKWDLNTSFECLNDSLIRLTFSTG